MQIEHLVPAPFREMKTAISQKQWGNNIGSERDRLTQLFGRTAKHVAFRNVGQFPIDPRDSIAHIRAQDIGRHNPIEVWIVDT